MPAQTLMAEEKRVGIHLFVPGMVLTRLLMV
jgi:hypothetical protein